MYTDQHMQQKHIDQCLLPGYDLSGFWCSWKEILKIPGRACLMPRCSLSLEFSLFWGALICSSCCFLTCCSQWSQPPGWHARLITRTRPYPINFKCAVKTQDSYHAFRVSADHRQGSLKAGRDSWEAPPLTRHFYVLGVNLAVQLSPLAV